MDLEREGYMSPFCKAGAQCRYNEGENNLKIAAKVRRLPIVGETLSYWLSTRADYNFQTAAYCNGCPFQITRT